MKSNILNQNDEMNLFTRGGYSHGGKRPGAGRKKTSANVQHCLRCTPDEWEQVKAFLAALRGRRIHPETGEELFRDVRRIGYKYKGIHFFVDMPGWYPKDSDDGIFTQEDMKVYDDALAAAKRKAGDTT